MLSFNSVTLIWSACKAHKPVLSLHGTLYGLRKAFQTTFLREQFLHYHYGYTALSWQMSAVLYAAVMLISLNQFV